MVDIIRFGIAYLIGFILIGLSVYNKKRWSRILSSAERARCFGVVVGFDEKLRKGSDATGYVYRLSVKYQTKTDEEIVSLSENTIHSPKEYSIGESVEISYRLSKPQSFYICDDRNALILNRFIFICGVLMFVMVTIFALSYEL